MNRLLLLLPLVLTGCEGVDLERMIDQPAYRAYEPTPYFPDGKVMQEPPPGTVPRSRLLGPPELVDGMKDGQFVTELPVPLDRAFLEHGQRRFDIFCAACHGFRGDGVSQVAENMTLRQPPSLIDAPVRDYPVGRVYRAITEGYGLMPAYAEELTVHDRWAVVAYLGALQLGQRAAFDELSEPLKTEAEKWLR